MQDTYVKLLYIAETVVDTFDVPSTVNGFTMNSERLLTCEGKGRKLAQLRIAVLSLAYEAFDLCDKDVRACLKSVVGTCTHREVLNRCQRYRDRDPEYDRRYALSRRRLRPDVWQSSFPVQKSEAHAVD